MGKSFAEQLAAAAALVNSFTMVREDAERAERAAVAKAREARKHESDAFATFLELSKQAVFEPVNPHG